MDTEPHGQFDKGLREGKRKAKIRKEVVRAVIALVIIIQLIVSFFLLSKVASLQEQMDLLMIEKYKITYSEMQTKDGLVIPALADAQIDKSDEEALEQGQETESAPVFQTEGSTGEQTRETKETIEKETEEQDDIENRKKVYLTFDDGPSENTPKVLDILKEYDVKATFFVTGRTDDFSKEMLKRIVDEGHSIGVHSYTHDYDKIYASLDAFKEDYYLLHDLIYETTGYKTDIYRFPGGSANKFTALPISTFIEFLAENDIVYYDWNIINGDYYSQGVSAEEAYDLVTEGVAMYNNSFVLMHDSGGKETTVESLAKIIETLQQNDCAILPLSKEVKPAQQVKVDDVVSK